jgi:hypothetical protein
VTVDGRDTDTRPRGDLTHGRVHRALRAEQQEAVERDERAVQLPGIALVRTYADPGQLLRDPRALGFASIAANTDDGLERPPRTLPMQSRHPKTPASSGSPLCVRL